MTLTVKFQAVEQHVINLIARVRQIESRERALVEAQNSLAALQEEKNILLRLIEEERQFLRSETLRMVSEGHNHFSGALDPEDHPK